MNAFDHFVKEVLREKYYIRYTDDAVILSPNREHLVEILPWIEAWLWGNRRITLHPKKTEIRKYRQGFDFLGYVARPGVTTLRTRTKRRMIKRVKKENIASYLGVLHHCAGHVLNVHVCAKVSQNGDNFPQPRQPPVSS